MTREEYRKSFAIRLASVEVKLANAASNNNMAEFMEATGELALLSTEPAPVFDEADPVVVHLRRNANGTITRLRGGRNYEMGNA